MAADLLPHVKRTFIQVQCSRKSYGHLLLFIMFEVAGLLSCTSCLCASNMLI